MRKILPINSTSKEQALGKERVNIESIINSVQETVIYNKVCKKYCLTIGEEKIDLFIEDKEADLFVSFLQDMNLPINKYT